MSSNIFSMKAKIAHDSRIAYEARAAAQLERMQAGPQIVGSTIVIPSEWYHKRAADFWRHIGATWCPGHPHGQAWVLNHEHTTYNRRTWSADQWLAAIRRKFAVFWPDLNTIPSRFCPTCGQEFTPWHPRQQFCHDCTS